MYTDSGRGGGGGVNDAEREPLELGMLNGKKLCPNGERCEKQIKITFMDLKIVS